MTRSVLSSLLVSACALSVSGCFALKAPDPIVSSVALDGIDPTAALDVETKVVTALENVEKKSSSCPSGHAEGSPECVVTRFTVKEPVTRTKTTMVSGSHRLTYAQFLTIAEHDRPQRAAALESDISKCKRARIPRYISIGLGVVAVGLLGYGAARQNKPLTYAGAGVGGTALIAGGAGLVMAKGSCRDARASAAELDLTDKDYEVCLLYTSDAADEAR
ncbi:MAG: hypothetical protein KUG77_07525, partial [Nannocystaceae bacterium]|nr:hypothetical protein [Nannocystaceae bacterium]